MGGLRRQALLPLVVASPAAVLAVATALWMAMAVFDAHPFWPNEPLTLSEAAALRDAGEVARLLDGGHDPNARYPIREGFLYNDAVVLTPVEAAVAADRPEIVALLVHAGATPPAERPAGDAPR